MVLAVRTAQVAADADSNGPPPASAEATGLLRALPVLLQPRTSAEPPPSLAVNRAWPAIVPYAARRLAPSAFRQRPDVNEQVTTLIIPDAAAGELHERRVEVAVAEWLADRPAGHVPPPNSVDEPGDRGWPDAVHLPTLPVDSETTSSATIPPLPETTLLSTLEPSLPSAGDTTTTAPSAGPESGSRIPRGTTSSALADLAVSIDEASRFPPIPGSFVYEESLLDYIIQIHNDGPDTATGIVVEIDLSAALSLLAVGEPTLGQVEIPGQWVIPDLAAGESAELFIQTRVEVPPIQAGPPMEDAVIAAEIIAADTSDPDSVPGNGAEDEDDFAIAGAGILYRTIDTFFQIPGTVFFDRSGNGLREPDEPGIANAVVLLQIPESPERGEPEGQPMATAITDDDGNFLFGNVPYGFYQVQLNPASLPANAAIPGSLNNPTPIFHSGDVESIPFGLTELCDIEGYVYLDFNGNQQADEDLGRAGLNDIVVDLFALSDPERMLADGITATDASGNMGFYSFSGLLPDTYLVRIRGGTLPSDLAIDNGTVAREVACPPLADSPANLPDFGLTLGVTAVELSEFAAARVGEECLVAWETALELEHLGFNLYRSSRPDEPEQRLNANLLLSPRPGEGNVYTWVDHEAGALDPVYYWLEDIDWSFHSTWHGPVRLDP